MTSMAPPSSSYESYPPLFRPNTIPIHQLGEPTVTTITGSDPLPLIDLQSLNHQDGGLALAEACKEWGIFRLVNHGVPMSLLSQLQDRARDLFSLSYDTKQAKGFGSPMNYFWGTAGLNRAGAPLQIERGPDPLNINWMEGFNAPLSQLSLQAQDPNLDSFRLLLEEYGRHQTRVATTIFRAMARNLKLDQQQSKSYLSTSTGNLRVYRYPRCCVPNLGWGIGAHTDSSVLSILSHDDVGGFQLLKDGKWLDVPPIPSTLVVNLGDIAQAMSNDAYNSVKHRVKSNKYQERISIGYFVFPAEDVVIQSSKYRPFTYADFRAQVQQDLRTIGHKLALEQFKIT